MEFDAFSSSGSFELQPCSVCGRKFNPDTLSKHETICRKSELKSRQRKVFDSSKQRIQGTSASLKNRSQPGHVKPQPVKDTHWRERHLDFVNSIRAARTAQIAIKTGGPLPPPPPPSHNPDYIGCPHCSRRFNQTAAERHIPFCAQRTKTLGSPVKPLYKRAAADVSYSTTGARKAYDNQVVRRKGPANQYVYATPALNEFPNMSVYSAAYGAATREPQIAVRQDFRNSRMHAASQSSVFESNSPSKTTKTNNRNNRAPSALSSGRTRTTRPKSSVRFSEKVNVETFQTNSDNAPPSPRPPPHPPPVYPGVKGPASYTSNPSGYRDVRTSDVRLRRAQTDCNGLGSPLSPVATNRGGTGRLLNSTFTWRDEDSPSFETTTRLGHVGGIPTNSHVPLENGIFSPPSSRGSPRELSSLTNSPQNYTPPLTAASHTPSPIDLFPKHGATLNPAVKGGVPAPFCFQCGTQYPVQDARFCCGCGMRRAYISPNLPS